MREEPEASGCEGTLLRLLRNRSATTPMPRKAGPRTIPSPTTRLKEDEMSLDNNLAADVSGELYSGVRPQRNRNAAAAKVAATRRRRAWAKGADDERYL
jgi:hypothetical protein